MSTDDDARARDAADELPTLRDQFHVPPHGEGEAAYFAGNSLGLQPKALRARLAQELDDWAQLGVEAHLEAARPWVSPRCSHGFTDSHSSKPAGETGETGEEKRKIQNQRTN